MEIDYRDARQSECLKLAQYINETAGGLLDYLYHGLIPGRETIDLLAEFLADGDRYDSYTSITVAEYQGEIIGLVSSYPASYHGIDREMEEFFPKSRLDLVRGFFETRVEDSYYLSAIYVSDQFRNRGIGSKLISLTKEKAKLYGYKELTLLVLENNEVAIEVYRKNGFKKIKHAKLGKNDFMSNAEGVFLLSSEL